MKTRLAFLLFLTTSTAARAQTPPPYASDQPVTEATLFAPGVISTGDYELNAIFSPDGRTVYFTKSTPDPRFSLMTMVASHYVDGRWTTPEVLPFSGQFSEVDPYLSPDGNTMFFTSQRPSSGTTPERDFDLWQSTRTASGWAAPTRLPDGINTESDEYYPGVAANGALYFSAVRDGGVGRYDLYRAPFENGTYGTPVNLGEAINSSQSEIDLYVDPQERFLIFVSYRNGGQGRGDLYISYQRDGTWTAAENLGDQVNTPAREYTPALTPDGRYLFFTSDRSFTAEPLAAPLSYEALQARLRGPGNGLGDIYFIEVAALGLDL